MNLKFLTWSVHKTNFLFQVLKFISDLGISKISLRQEDIESILDTLIFDGKVQPKPDRHCMLTNELVQSNKRRSIKCGWTFRVLRSKSRVFLAFCSKFWAIFSMNISIMKQNIFLTGWTNNGCGSRRRGSAVPSNWTSFTNHRIGTKFCYLQT